MRASLILLLTICICAALHAEPFVDNRFLEDDLEDFWNLIPHEEIRAIVEEYVANDAEVREVFAYLKSDEFATAWKYTVEHPDILELLSYLQVLHHIFTIQESGLDVKEFPDKITDLMKRQQSQVDAILPLEHEDIRSSDGVQVLVKEVLDLLPLTDMMILFFEKMDSSEDFQRMMERVQSADFQKIVDFAERSPEVLAVINKIEDLGFDVQALADHVRTFFGW